MRRYRPTLLSPFGRRVIALAIATIATATLCGGAYLDTPHFVHQIVSEAADG